MKAIVDLFRIFQGCDHYPGSPNLVYRARRSKTLFTRMSARSMHSSYHFQSRSRLTSCSHLTADRWHYILSSDADDRRILFDPEVGLAVCGDWLAGGRVEGASLSVVGAADAICNSKGFNLLRSHRRHIARGGQPAYFVRSEFTVQGASNLSQNTWRFDTRWFNYQYAPRDARCLYAVETVEIKVITGQIMRRGSCRRVSAVALPPSH